MAVVKGSKQERMVVVPYRPWQAVTVRLGIIAIMLVIASCFYFFGYNKGITENNDARVERDDLRREVESSNSEIEELRQEVVNNEQTRDVNQKAIQEVQKSILALRETNAQLEEDILFYKQVMSPEKNESGLVIGQLHLVAGEFGEVRYRIEFKQMGNNETALTGYANVTVLGMLEGRKELIPLHSLSTSEEGVDIKLQFKYFQNLEGELTLPADFKPKEIQVMAVTKGKKSKTIEKIFPWIVER